MEDPLFIPVAEPLRDSRGWVESWIEDFENSHGVVVVIHDRHGVLADERGEELLPERCLSHCMAQCAPGRSTGTPDIKVKARCHFHCWEGVGQRVSSRQPLLMHSCWRGRRELVIAGLDQGEHLLNLFIGPTPGGADLSEDLGKLIVEGRALISYIFSVMNPTGRAGDERRRIIQRLLMRVESDPQLCDVAESLGVSRHRASHLVRELFGNSWRQLRLEARLKRATFLLQRPRLSVKEIALHCGWQDVNGFIRQFRKHFGQSPGAWRKMNPVSGAALNLES